MTDLDTSGIEGEVVSHNQTTTDGILSAISDLIGCGCCSSTHEATTILGPCPPESECVPGSHSYGDHCYATTAVALQSLIDLYVDTVNMAGH